MRKPTIILTLILAFAAFTIRCDASDPIKVMLITGGCCHEYDYQTKQLKAAFEENDVEVEWKVVQEGGTSKDYQSKLYDNPDWAKGFDVVIHNECFAKTVDTEYIRKITSAHHAGANAVVIHCAMHTYRDAKIDDWREMLGVTSHHHEHQSNYPVKVVASDHPIMKGFPAKWKTPMDELYIIKAQQSKTTPLATSVSEKSGEAHPCFWTNEYGQSRVFGTTYGHSNETFDDKVFRRTVVRGTLWAAGRLK